MREYRMCFEKTGQGIYISHLDLMRTMQRSLLRAGLRIKHTEGFNPRPHMVFALPLSVGCSSVCELVDFTLETDIPYQQLCGLIAPFFPSGVKPVCAYEPTRKFKTIKWVKLTGRLEYDRPVADEDLSALRELFSRKEIVVLRKTKRGEDEFDIVPHIKDYDAKAEGESALLQITISAQEPSINPALLTGAMNRYLGEAGPKFCTYRREMLLDMDNTPFE